MALTGVYTLMMDDTAGSLGQKVSVYLQGTDPSGYALQDGGSDEDGEQLFMYQLAVDGAPDLEPDAFGWSDGRQSWLHPAQPYELNVKISEPNGGSDLSTVEVMLASNQGKRCHEHSVGVRKRRVHHHLHPHHHRPVHHVGGQRRGRSLRKGTGAEHSPATRLEHTRFG